MRKDFWDRREFLTTGAGIALGGQQAAGSGIWDLHTHLNDASLPTPEARIEALLRFADRMGIERLVLSLGAPLLADPTPKQLREANNQVLVAVRRWPDRVLGFVYLSPNHLAFSLEEFDCCVRDGPMVGIKLWIAKRCSAPELDPIVERAESMQAVVFQHTWYKVAGNEPGESTPLDVVRLARRHPHAQIFCGHCGGDWELGLRTVRDTPNVPVGIAGSNPAAGFVEMAVAEVGAERVVYGSDAPGRSFASQMGKVLGAEIPDRDKRLILGGNLKRLLTPMLKAKGIRLDG